MKILISELKEWKKIYGVGYLGCELAEGWLNKWELKKNMKEKQRRNM